MPADDLKARSRRILRALKRLFPEAPCALRYSNPLELLVATVLSAQCTDVRVNVVSKELFRRYRSAADFARAPREELEEAIRSTGFFRSKAKAIQGIARALEARHGGEVPRTLEELVRLPGVGRKTANVVLGEAFGVASGVVVDTHVKRITGRLGLTGNSDPDKIEKDLMEIFPRKEWIRLSMRLILHGRDLCSARKPRCGECPVLDDCHFGQREASGAGLPAKAASRRQRGAPSARLGKPATRKANRRAPAG